MTSWTVCVTHVHQQAGCPCVTMTYQNLFIDLTFACASHQLPNLTASHFQAIITQNENENMPMMVLIV